MNKEFYFYMNERSWKILEKTQEEMFNYYKEENVGYYYGQTHFKEQEIWISDDIPKTQLDKTLFHELMHCYIRMYITTQELEYNEESLCDISANAYKIILPIITDFIQYKNRLEGDSKRDLLQERIDKAIKCIENKDKRY